MSSSHLQSEEGETPHCFHQEGEGPFHSLSCQSAGSFAEQMMVVGVALVTAGLGQGLDTKAIGDSK